MSEEIATYGGGEAERDHRVVDVATFVVGGAGETLVAYGLGACVAVGVRDTERGVGALAHVVLPERPDESGAAAGKFADSAVPAMLQQVVEAGAAYDDLDAFVVGGADIFALPELPTGVGERTAEVARAALADAGVSVVADLVGGDQGRSVEFDAASGVVGVRTAGEEYETVVGGGQD
jgi:chemotaxis protein CheD